MQENFYKAEMCCVKLFFAWFAGLQGMKRILFVGQDLPFLQWCEPSLQSYCSLSQPVTDGTHWSLSWLAEPRLMTPNGSSPPAEFNRLSAEVEKAISRGASRGETVTSHNCGSWCWVNQCALSRTSNAWVMSALQLLLSRQPFFWISICELIDWWCTTCIRHLNVGNFCPSKFITSLTVSLFWVRQLHTCHITGVHRTAEPESL